MRELENMERTIDVRGGHLDSSLNCSVISGLVALSENERSIAPECEMKWACKAMLPSR